MESKPILKYKFLVQLRKYQLLKEDLLHGVSKLVNVFYRG
jgi:hypothetical protein